MSIVTAYRLTAYFVTLFLFGVFGMALNLLSLGCGWLPDRDGVRRFFQRVVQGHLALLLWWARRASLVRVRYEGWDRLPRGGFVLVGNHPGMLDIVYLFARVPHAFCIYKPAIGRNPMFGATARRAGYLPNDGGHDLVRRAAAQVAAGQTLVVFPEGTRSSGGAVHPFRPGFILVARRARAPIQLVRLDSNSDMLVKGRPWWSPPKLPAEVTVTVGPRITADPDREVAALAREVEAWFRSRPEGLERFQEAESSAAVSSRELTALK